MQYGLAREIHRFQSNILTTNISIAQYQRIFCLLGGNSGESKGSNERLLAQRRFVKVGDVKRTFSATDAIASSSGVAVEALCIGSLGGPPVAPPL